MTSPETIRVGQAGHPEGGGRRRRGTREWTRAWSVVPAVALVVVILIAPVVLLLTRSFWDPDFTLKHYTELFADRTSRTVLERTLMMSVIVTGVTLLLAYPYAAVMTMVTRRVRAVMLALVLLPFWTSLMARTFAWLILLQEDGPVSALLGVVGFSHVTLAGTATGVIVGMTQVLLPFMVLPLYSVFSQIDLHLVSAAKSLGAHPAVAFATVYLPLSLPGVFAGVTLVFILALGFYVTPALLGTPKESMIAQVIDIKVTRLLDFAAGGALSLVLVTIILVLLASVARFGRVTQALGVVGKTR